MDSLQSTSSGLIGTGHSIQGSQTATGAIASAHVHVLLALLILLEAASSAAGLTIDLTHCPVRLLTFVSLYSSA